MDLEDQTLNLLQHIYHLFTNYLQLSPSNTCPFSISQFRRRNMYSASTYMYFYFC